jgi:hypothetical protein
MILRHSLARSLLILAWLRAYRRNVTATMELASASDDARSRG